MKGKRGEVRIAEKARFSLQGFAGWYPAASIFTDLFRTRIRGTPLDVCTGDAIFHKTGTRKIPPSR